MKEIKQGPSFGRLSSRLQQKIKNYKQQNWIDDKHADVVNLVKNLPQGLRSQVKGELGTELLRNVSSCYIYIYIAKTITRSNLLIMEKKLGNEFEKDPKI